MTEYEYIKEEEAKILVKDVEAWFAKNITAPYQFLGGLKRLGWSYHDVDFAFKYLPTDDPDTCPCKAEMGKLPSAPWLMHGMCLGCGAKISYRPESDKWTWFWAPGIAWRVKNEWIQEWADQGIVIGITFIHDLAKRVETLEQKVAAIVVP